MNFLQKYIEYLKDNPNHYWFKRKLFGWGWTPVTWEGWAVTLAFIAFFLWSGVDFANTVGESEPTQDQLFWFFTQIGIAAVLLIVICWRTGEPPKWTWGIPKKDTNQK